jgi:hypothetical protein
MADSNSSIAWHRAQIRTHQKELADYESGDVTIQKIKGSKVVDYTQTEIANLKELIAHSEEVIAADEKRDT